MHALSTNQIADILYFHDNNIITILQYRYLLGQFA